MGGVRKHQIGENVARKDKVKFLVNTVSMRFKFMLYNVCTGKTESYREYVMLFEKLGQID